MSEKLLLIWDNNEWDEEESNVRKLKIYIRNLKILQLHVYSQMFLKNFTDI